MMKEVKYDELRARDGWRLETGDWRLEVETSRQIGI